MPSTKTTSVLTILVTDVSEGKIRGHDIDGGELKEFSIDPISTKNTGDAKVGERAFVHVEKKPNNGERVQDDVLQPAKEIYYFDPKVEQTIELLGFEIIKVKTTEANIGGPFDGGGSFYYLKGRAEDDSDYVLPVETGDTYPSWDLAALETCLMNVQIAQYEGTTPSTRVSHEKSIRA